MGTREAKAEGGRAQCTLSTYHVCMLCLSLDTPLTIAEKGSASNPEPLLTDRVFSLHHLPSSSLARRRVGDLRIGDSQQQVSTLYIPTLDMLLWKNRDIREDFQEEGFIDMY